MMRLIFLVLLLAISASTANAAEGNVDLPRFPSISPDGSQIAFTWRGDLWKVAAGGGAAQRLTSHPQDELQSAWSRDGRRIAFISTRSGAINLWLMDADGTGLRQLVTSDRPQGLAGFGTDENGREVITFTARFDPENYPAARPYMIAPEGGEPRRVHEAYGAFPIVSPDGTRVLFDRGGASWSRRHYRGPDTRDVWLYDRKAGSFTRITQRRGNEGRGRWIDNHSIVFASDREQDTVNLYRLTLGQPEEQARKLTRFTEVDVEEFDVSADGKTLVFARWDKLYTLDLTREGAEPVALSIRATEDEADRYLIKDMSRSISEAQLSPDGKTMALISYGQVYVRAIEKNSPTRRVSTAQSRHRDIAWSADGTRLLFVSDESGVESIYEAGVTLTRSEIRKQYETATKPRPATTRATTDATTEPATQSATQPETQPTTLAASQPSTAPTTQPGKDPTRWADAVTFEIRQLSTSPQGDTMPSPSPDGKKLAFRRGPGNLMVMDLTTREVRPLLQNWSSSLDWRWSPDSQRIAYVTDDENFNSDIWLAKVDGSEPAVNVTRHPDADGSPRFSADGKILAFVSERVNDEYDIWMVWLDKSMESLSAGELDQYFKDAAANAKKRKPPSATQPTTAPTTRESKDDAKLNLDDAYLRVRRVTSFPGSESQIELSAAGDKYYFVATLGPTRATWALDRDATEPKRLAAATNVQHLSLTGEQLVVIEGNRGGYLKLPEGTLEYVDIADKQRIDLQAQSSQKFMEAARIVGSSYYDPKMGGLDWPAVVKRYHALALAARTNDEFDHVAAKLVGELNGSHLGINTPDPPNPQSRPFGYLGIKTSREAGGYRVNAVLPDGPAHRAATPLQLGDLIIAIDQEPFEPDEIFDQKLAGKTDREVLVSVEREGRVLSLLMTPIAYQQLSDLAYKNWRLEAAKKVDEWSGGKVGYIHIQSMSQDSLDVFERDLYAAAHGKRGLVIDVRNNGGGWTTDRLLASIMYPRHAYTVPRGLDPSINTGYPQDRLFIQRYTGPVNMLCNEKSFSNAEIISHAFKTLKRGTLVGQQTAGGVISTGGTSLLDGTMVRIPFRGWFLPDGSNMENNGAVPDILVPQTPEDEALGNDSQLKACVEDLLKRL